MKISHKLILSFLLVATLASLTTLFTLRSYREINRSFDQLIDDPTQMVAALNGMKQAGIRIVSSTSELSFIHSEALRTGKADTDEDAEVDMLVRDGHEAFRTSLEKYRELVRTIAPDEAETMSNVEASGDQLIKTSDEIIRLNKTAIHRNELLEKREQFETDEVLFLKIVDEAMEKESGEQDEGQAKVDESIALATRETMIVTFLTFALALFSGFYISFLISRRMGKLREATKRVGEGDLDTYIEIKSKDEVAELAQSFNNMIADLQESRQSTLSAQSFTDNIIGSIASALFVLDMDLTIVRVNEAAIVTCGFTEAELIGQPIRLLWTDARFFGEESLLEMGSGDSVSGIETFLRRKDGSQVPVLFSASIMRETEGSAYGIVCVAQDITQRKSLENQLTHQALHDPLTKLANRVLFRDRVEHGVNRTKRNHAPLAVLFLDLDNFKSVNDTLGHAAGDELLLSVTKRLKICLRASDTPARLGGDEFAILLEDLEHAEQAAFIAERIRTVLGTPYSIAGTEVFISCSIGIAITVDGSESPEDLLRNADVAMYTSKRNGKDRYTIFENAMHEVLVKRLRLEADMRAAIDNHEFELHYQPIMDLQTHEIMGMEALVRWNHPEQGLLPPMDFIPLAEDSGLIVPLGRWILEEACRQTSEWQTGRKDGDRLSITVNIASRQFVEDGLTAAVQQALKKSKLPAYNLILEITETTMLSNAEATIAKLHELRKLGVRFAVDDFGTGYSSLSYLQRFPVSILKIDKSFIDRLAIDKESSAVAQAIITMSETLNLTTIAEGIETPGQQSILQDLGCELGQGFHFAKPLNAADMKRFLTSALVKIDDTLPIISIISSSNAAKSPVGV